MATPAALELATGQGLAVGITVAGVGARSYAFLIDWHIRTLLAVAWPLLFVAAGWALGPGGLANLVERTGIALVAGPAVAIYLLYHPLLEVLLHGSTPGKRMAGVRVVAEDGRQATFAMLTVRNVFRLLDSAPMFYCVGIASCLLTKRAVRIGDLAAGTVLIYDDYDSRALRRSIERHTEAHACTPETLRLVEDLVARWNELEPARCRRMAHDLLAAVGAGLEPSATDAQLLGQLQGLITARKQP